MNDNKQQLPGQPPEAGSIPELVPLFAPRDLVIFPGLIVPMHIGDERVISMIDDAVESGSRIIGCFLRKPDAGEEDFTDVHEVGTALVIHRMMRVGDGTVRLIVQGIERIELREVRRPKSKPYPQALIRVLDSSKARKTVKLEAHLRALREEFETIAELNPQLPEELRMAVANIDDPAGLADLIASNLSLDNQVRQRLLAATHIGDRIKLLRELLQRELRVLKVGNQIQSQAREEIEKGQRDYLLRQQLKQIKKELGEDEEGGEAERWREKIDEADLPESVLEVAEKELERLERMNPASAEYSVVTTYLDWLIDLPWKKSTEDNLDLVHAREVLDEDHYGLEDVKDRIIEGLAVRKLRKDPAGPILCFVGPPGVGKTSLGKSIARAMGREFVRISLGGVRDEAEIRGHRRTYVGAMPGRIIQSLKKAGSRNPVFMLDEIDKLVSDFRGDPSSALLEVLDPAQNDSFNDHYLDMEFDLSATLFIATANYLENVPAPLRDRMEIIRLSGYVLQEKSAIARQYLVPRQIEANGLLKKHIRFHKAALEEMITYYTREAGVRNLERTIGKACRKAATVVATKKRPKLPIKVTKENIESYLGPRRITPSWVQRRAEVGQAVGLAYTPAGGDVLQIETSLMPGKGGVKVTGRLGDVMKESAQISVSWIRAHSEQLEIDDESFKKHDIHIHVPEGATPKDGPSAGITMTTALASLLTERPARADLAMTGEITLTGRVLPIGGLREKVTAAHRSRIKHIILPKLNMKDLEKVPEKVRGAISFHPVESIDEVLEIALHERRRNKVSPASASTKSSGQTERSKQKSGNKAGKG